MNGKKFLALCNEYLEKIEQEQAENFAAAGKLVGDRIMQGGVIHVFGTGGHAILPAYAMFYRAGGLCAVNFIVPLGALYGAASATYGMRIERTVGYMKQVIDYHRINKDDVCIIFNNIGVNAATIDAALACKERGAKTIGVAGSPWQEAIPTGHRTRHPSNKNLMDIVDVFIDDYNPVGDVVITVEGFDRMIAPISQVTDSYIVRRIEIEAVEYMVAKGFAPDVWVSANTVGGDEANAAYQAKYYNRIKLL